MKEKISFINFSEEGLQGGPTHVNILPRFGNLSLISRLEFN